MAAHGLLQYNFGQQEPAQTEEDAQNAAARAAQAADSLGGQLQKKWVEWSDMVGPLRDDWIKDLRSFEGQYDQAISSAIDENRSKVFLHISRVKVMAAFARLTSMLDGKHWSIKPTPMPDLPPEKMDEVRQQIVRMITQRAIVETGMPPLPEDAPTDEEVELVAKMLAEKTCKRMERLIEDQLTEIHYDRELDTALAEMCMLGTGVLKGPTIDVIRSQKWQKTGQTWELTDTEKVMPGIKAVSIFDVTPDPYCTHVKNASGVFERHLLNRDQFDELSRQPGFDPDKIRDCILNHENGTHSPDQHERDRRQIAGYTTTSGESGHYEVLEYWGLVSGRGLQTAGMPDVDVAKTYHANVWVCSGMTLKAIVNPTKPQRIPYHFIPYMRVPHKFWGDGVVKLMRDSQVTMNSATRAMLDNLAISSGPQVEVNMSMLAPGQDATDQHPWKLWLREGGDPGAPMLRFYNAGNNSSELIRVIELFRMFADEETMIPSYLHGDNQKALNQTATGASIQNGAANLGTKSVLRNVDDNGIEPIISGMYHFNMEHSDDESVKGDLQVLAIGSTTLVSKEIQSQRLMQFAQLTANPFDAQFIKRRELLEEIASSIDIGIDKVFYEDNGDQQQQVNSAGVVGGPGAGGQSTVAGAQQLPVAPVGAG